MIGLKGDITVDSQKERAGDTSKEEGMFSLCCKRVQRMRSSKGAVLFVCSLALFTDMLVYGIVIPILPDILKSIGIEEGHRTASSTILFSAYAFGLFLATPIFGYISDKYNNRQIPMLLGLAGLSVTTIIFALSHSFSSLLIARFLQGVSGAASWVVGMALVADTFPLSQLGSAVGFVMSFNTVGFMCGPVISGYAATFISLRAPFYICVVFAMLDFLARLFLKPKRIGRPEAAKVAENAGSADNVHSVGGGDTRVSSMPNGREESSFLSLFSIFWNAEIVLHCVAVILGSVSFSIIEALIAEYLQKEFSLGIADCATTLLFFILPNAFFSIVIGWMADMFTRTRLVLIGMVLHALSSPFVGLSSSIGEFRLSAVFFGLTCSFMMTPIMPQMAFLMKSYGSWTSSYAKLYSLFSLSYSLGMVVGPIIAGFLMSRLSFFAAMTMFPICIIIFAPVYAFVCVTMERRRFADSNKINSELPAARSRGERSFWRELVWPSPEPVYGKWDPPLQDDQDSEDEKVVAV